MEKDTCVVSQDLSRCLAASQRARITQKSATKQRTKVHRLNVYNGDIQETAVINEDLGTVFVGDKSDPLRITFVNVTSESVDVTLPNLVQNGITVVGALNFCVLPHLAHTVQFRWEPKLLGVLSLSFQIVWGVQNSISKLKLAGKCIDPPSRKRLSEILSAPHAKSSYIADNKDVLSATVSAVSSNKIFATPQSHKPPRLCLSTTRRPSNSAAAHCPPSISDENQIPGDSLANLIASPSPPKRPRVSLTPCGPLPGIVLSTPQHPRSTSIVTPLSCTPFRTCYTPSLQSMCPLSLSEQKWPRHEAHCLQTWLNDVFGSTIGKPCIKWDDLQKGTMLIQENEAMIRKLEEVILSEALQIRADIDLELNICYREVASLFYLHSTKLSNLSVSQQFLISLLLNFNEVWLKYGLQVLFAMEINRSLDTFLREYFFSDLKTRGRSKLERAKRQMNDTILHRFLVLVWFLDTSRNLSTLEEPCLYNRLSKIKTTRNLLHEFQVILGGMGDLVKRLESWEFCVSFEQTPLHEYIFKICDITRDLRDGVKLCRLADILMETQGMGTPLLPVTSSILIQQYHNIRLALAYFSKFLHIDYTDYCGAIAEGNGEKTLLLLWDIALLWFLPRITPLDKLELETKRLEQTTTVLPLDPESRGCSLPVLSLLKWCRVIVAHNSIAVRNFSVDFADGVVLCLVLSFYLPTEVPVGNIVMEHLFNLEKNTMRTNRKLSWTEEGSCNQVINDSILWKARVSNYQLMRSSLGFLGIPDLVDIQSMKEIPDAKVITLLVACLCARLLEPFDIPVPKQGIYSIWFLHNSSKYKKGTTRHAKKRSFFSCRQCNH
ncbi:Protein abnormal spindle [Pelomyxa schiedti]|nr:Protein abnormal spindle [Pelomyxa schiedti]